MTAVVEPLGGIPEAWKAHESWSWDAQAPVYDPLGPIRVSTSALRGWTSCSCGFESTPRDNLHILPLTYAEAMQAYIDHLPPGMAAWLAKREAGPRDNHERVARVRTLVESAQEGGATSLSVELVKDALGWYR